MGDDKSRETTLLNGLKQINLQGEVVKGIKCVIKSVLEKKAKHVVYASDIDNQKMKEAISALCKSNSIPSDSVSTRQELARHLSFSKCRNKNGEKLPKKGCAVCAVVSLGHESLQNDPLVKDYRETFLQDSKGSQESK